MHAPPRRYDLLEGRLHRVTRMLPRVEKGRPDAIHAARVMSRRLRELLPLLGLEASTAHKIGRRLRKVTRRLGKLRDVDVLLGLVDEFEASDRLARPALARVRHELRGTRDRRRAVVRRRKAIADLRHLLRKLDEVARSLKDAPSSPAREREVRWAAKARVARRAATVKRAVEEAGSVYLPERIHAVRISLKKLRYGAEVAAETTGTVRADDLRELKRTQDLLGRLHDTQMFIDHVRKLQGSLTPPDLRAWQELDVLVASLEKRSRRMHARYVRAVPRLLMLCDRLGTRAAAIEASSARRKAS